MIESFFLQFAHNLIVTGLGLSRVSLFQVFWDISSVSVCLCYRVEKQTRFKSKLFLPPISINYVLITLNANVKWTENCSVEHFGTKRARRSLLRTWSAHWRKIIHVVSNTSNEKVHPLLHPRNFQGNRTLSFKNSFGNSPGNLWKRGCTYFTNFSVKKAIGESKLEIAG